MSTEDEIALHQPVTIAVVMASYNERLALAVAVDRLLVVHDVSQLVVVDASDDEQSKQIRTLLDVDARDPKWSDRVTIVSAAQPGRGTQMNTGASLVDAQVLLFLHVDTVLPPQAINLIQQHVSAGARWGRFDVHIDDPYWPFRVIETMMNFRSALSSICTGDQSIFVSTALFHRIGGFGDMVLMEDIDLSARLKQQCRPAIIKSRVKTSSRRWRQRGIIRTIFLMWALRAGFFLGVSPRRLANWYRQSNETTK